MSNKIKEYCVVTALLGDKDMIEKKVWLKIQEGWTLFGGVTISVAKTYTIFAQAMVKY